MYYNAPEGCRHGTHNTADVGGALRPVPRFRALYVGRLQTDTGPDKPVNEFQ